MDGRKADGEGTADKRRSDSGGTADKRRSDSGGAAERKLSGRNPESGELSEITESNLWDEIVLHAGETFHTKKGLPFTYTVKGGELFTDRRERSITRSTFEKAYRKIRENPDHIVGPKALNVYGAPYVWAVFMGIGVVEKC